MKTLEKVLEDLDAKVESFERDVTGPVAEDVGIELRLTAQPRITSWEELR